MVLEGFKNVYDQLTMTEAVEIFDRLADMDDIAFGYKRDGCYARAHIMCRRMMRAGLNPGKAWAFEGKKRLQVKAPDGTLESWWYHVAPSLKVQMPNGTIQSMVFDPGLFDGPATLHEWGEIMGAEYQNLQLLKFGERPRKDLGDYNTYLDTDSKSDKNASKKMMEYRSYQPKHQRILFASRGRHELINQSQSAAGQQQQRPAQIAQHFSQQSAGYPGLQGRTWISVVLYEQLKQDKNFNGLPETLEVPPQYSLLQRLKHSLLGNRL